MLSSNTQTANNRYGTSSSLKNRDVGSPWTDERIENEPPFEEGQPDVYFYYRYQHGRPVLNVLGQDRRELKRDDVDP